MRTTILQSGTNLYGGGGWEMWLDDAVPGKVMICTPTAAGEGQADAFSVDEAVRFAKAILQLAAV